MGAKAEQIRSRVAAKVQAKLEQLDSAHGTSKTGLKEALQGSKSGPLNMLKVFNPFGPKGSGSISQDLKDARSAWAQALKDVPKLAAKSGVDRTKLAAYVTLSNAFAKWLEDHANDDDATLERAAKAFEKQNKL
jgi:hypothetical protein